MFNYEETLQAMRSQRASMQRELDRLDRAISALQTVVGSPAGTTTKPRTQSRREVRQSVGKLLVSAKQAKATKERKAEKPKPQISAQGLRNIVEAQKKRWAKVRAAAKGKAKAAAKAKGKPAADKKVPEPTTRH